MVYRYFMGIADDINKKDSKNTPAKKGMIKHINSSIPQNKNLGTLFKVLRM